MNITCQVIAGEEAMIAKELWGRQWGRGSRLPAEDGQVELVGEVIERERHSWL